MVLLGGVVDAGVPSGGQGSDDAVPGADGTGAAEGIGPAAPALHTVVARSTTATPAALNDLRRDGRLIGPTELDQRLSPLGSPFAP